MKERPIIFSGPMVRAILDSSKTQTRRLVKPQPQEICQGMCTKVRHCFTVGDTHCHPAGGTPYGLPGDELWVRESWCQKWNERGFVYNSEGNLDASCVHYQADGYGVIACDGDGFLKWRKDGARASPWKSPLFMPRWASRLTLVVKAVRVERLHDMNGYDCEAEGFIHQEGRKWCLPGWDRDYVDWERAFADLWDSLYPKHPEKQWDANPWVWVIEFEVKA